MDDKTNNRAADAGELSAAPFSEGALALMLAEMGDPRCVAPLVRVFSMGGLLQNKYHDQITAALTQFLRDELKLEVAVQLGVRAGGSHGPVVNSWRSAWSLLMPHLVAVSR